MLRQLLISIQQIVWFQGICRTIMNCTQRLIHPRWLEAYQALSMHIIWTKYLFTKYRTQTNNSYFLLKSDIQRRWRNTMKVFYWWRRKGVSHRDDLNSRLETVWWTCLEIRTIIWNGVSRYFNVWPRRLICWLSWAR